jgi:hypothetical protein
VLRITKVSHIFIHDIGINNGLNGDALSWFDSMLQNFLSKNKVWLIKVGIIFLSINKPTTQILI